MDDPDNGSPNKHLRIVVSDPDEDDYVMLVTVCSARTQRRIPNDCPLQPGDHDFIKKESYIAYRHSIEMSTVELEKKRRTHRIIPKEDISDELLVRIQDGAKKSYDLPTKFFKYFDSF